LRGWLAEKPGFARRIARIAKKVFFICFACVDGFKLPCYFFQRSFCRSVGGKLHPDLDSNVMRSIKMGLVSIVCFP